MSTAPPPYSRQANFVSFESSAPTDPKPGTSLDAEFDDIKTSLDATQSRLAEIQRDDGKLANASVHPDALDAATLAMIEQEASGVSPLLRADLASSDAGLGSDLVSFPDPVAPAFLKTTSDILNGERVSVLRGIAKAKHAGIRAGTNADDLTADIQGLLSAMAAAGFGDLYMPNGVYNSLGLTAANGIQIRGANATIKALPSLGAGTPLLINTNFGAAPDETTDNNMLFEGLVFDASAIAADRSVELLSFIKAGSLTMRNVRVVGPRYTGIAFGGCKNIVLDRVEASGTGKQAVTAEGGAAIYIGPYLGDGSTSENVRLLMPYVHDTEWSALYASGQNIEVISPRFHNIKESALFGVADGLFVSGGTISNVTKKFISASGVELGGKGVRIHGTRIESSEHSSIAFTDVQNFDVAGCQLYDFGKELAANGAGVMVLTTETAPNQPKNGAIRDNRIVDRQGTPTGYSAVSVVNSGAAIENVRIYDNDCTGWTQRGPKMIDIAAGKWGAGCVRRDNVGTPDANPVHLSFQVSPGTGSKSVTGIGFRPRRLEFRVTQIGSATDATLSLGSADSTGLGRCIHMEARTTATAGARSGEGGTNKIWHMVDAAGAIIADAFFTSYDDDGFSYNVGVAAAQPRVHVVAYP